MLKDIEKIGKKYEVKEVASGHARNFLIPNGFAKVATKEAITWLETQKEIEAKKAEEELKTFQDRATALDGQEFTFAVKVGDEGQLFESINVQKIAEKLKEGGFEIKKSQIILEEPIKSFGEFPVKIKLEHNLEAEIKIIISEGDESKDSSLPSSRKAGLGE